MRIPVSRMLGVVLTAALLTGSARAENHHVESNDLRFASYSDRLLVLEAELASFRAVENASWAGGGDACDCPTWTYMAELPWLQVHDAGLAVPGIPVMTPHYGQEASIRASIGREFGNGLGFRITGFQFDDTAGNGMVGPVALASSTEIYAVDFELTARGSFCGWDSITTGGIRIGGLDQSLDVIVGADSIALARDFDGAGLTAGIEFTRPLGKTAMSAYGGFQASLLFGDADINVATAGPNVPAIAATIATIPNQTVAVWELQLGVELERETNLGRAVARIGLEAQMWEQPPVVLGLGDDNIGFFGPTFALSFER